MAWKTLMNAKTQLSKNGTSGYHQVRPGRRVNAITTVLDILSPTPVLHVEVGMDRLLGTQGHYTRRLLSDLGPAVRATTAVLQEYVVAKTVLSFYKSNSSYCIGLASTRTRRWRIYPREQSDVLMEASLSWTSALARCIRW